MKTHGGSGCIAPPFLISTSDGDEWPVYAPAGLPPGKAQIIKIYTTNTTCLISCMSQKIHG
jgi:hypothetical protein